MVKPVRLAHLMVAALLGATSAVTARAATPADIEFVTTVREIVDFDRRVIEQLLFTRTANPQVRALAMDMLTHANEFYDEVEPVAQAEGIAPPTGNSLNVAGDRQREIDELMSTRAENFDRDFLSDEISVHKQVIARRDAMIMDPGSNPRLVELVRQAGPRLENNLRRLEAAQANLRD